MKIANKTVKVAFAIFLMAFTSASVLWAAPPIAETAAIVRAEKPSVEVVFVLDTTGSMSGLIEAAKEKIWSIANTLASGNPAPEIKMGLVGYRDRGDAYVTKFTSLTSDLDAVYAELMQFSADGGGDTPESVNQALYEAVTNTPWSKKNSTYRVIFLVGDAPPHMNYQKDVRYQKSCRMAAGKGIIINTIQCGQMPETTPAWKEIARMAEGQYFQVAQSGSAVLYDTPFDRKIADLSKALDETRIYYGSTEHKAQMAARQETADRIYEAAAPSAVAKRTIFNAKSAGAKNFLGSQELVSDIASGKVDWKDIEKEALPEEMKPMSPVERKNHVAAMTKKRADLQARIDKLGKQRQAFIAEKVKEEQGRGADSLDARIFKCIQTQASVKKIEYDGGPEY